MKLRSPAFEHEGFIPKKYSCDGDDISPPLEIDDLPEGAVALALVMDDPDAPGGTFDHWVAYDIEPQATIPEGVDLLGTEGRNSWGRTGYGGPCPPGGTHRYFFTLYALDARLELASGATKEELRRALAGHVLVEDSLMSRYAR